MPPQRSQPFGLKTVSPLLKPSAASLGSASKSAVVRLRCVLQRSQSTRTSRWAITARSVDLSRTGINSGEHNGPRGIAGLCSIDQRRPACVCGNRESHRGRQRCERIVCRLRLDYHIGRKSVSPALKQLSALGLLDIQPGPRLVNIFRFSNCWRTIDAVEAVRKYNAAARSDIPAQKRSAAVRNRWSRTALTSTSAGVRRPRASEGGDVAFVPHSSRRRL